MVSPEEGRPGFSLGRLLITRRARSELTEEDIWTALFRHQSGDWGELELEDEARNDIAVISGARLVSVYHSKAGNRFYVITEADRSSTTVLLPHEY